MNNYEDQIRDNLALDLSVFGLDLVLIEKEHYLPAAKTTKSFIDILAKDNKNNYVIIEVKRSKQTEREAIHEIYKYTEAIKDKYKLSPGEVWSIIVSTDWEELFIPFSAFVNESKNTVFGFKLVVDGNYKPTSITKVIPCKTSNGRLFSSVHDCNQYKNQVNLDFGVQSHVKVLKEKNIEDYVLLILKASPFDKIKHAENFKDTINHINQQFLKDDELIDFPENIEDQIDEYKFMIYCAFRRLTKDEYFKILSGDPEKLIETRSYIEDNITDEDEIVTALEATILNSLEPRFYSDYGEIGYSGKFMKFISSEEPWEILEIKRSTSLAANVLLTDEKIISEIEGDTGLNNITFDDQCNLSHKAKYNEIKARVTNTLKFNKVWQNDIKAFFEQIDKMEDGELEVHIFSPNNILLTIIRMAIEGISDWLPKYVIKVANGNNITCFMGTFDWNKREPKFKEIVEKYFDNEPKKILLPMMWVGEYIESNSDILEDLGLSYQSGLYKENNSGKTFYRYSNYKFKQTEQLKTEIIDFIAYSQEFTSELVKVYKTYYYNGILEIN